MDAGCEATRPNSPVRKVVNISSTMGIHCSYSACLLGRQGGSSRYYQNPGKGMGRFNVTVNAVAFGAIDTRLTSPYESEPNIFMVKGQARKVFES